MPRASEHLTRAENNLRFAESFDLKSTPFLDWVVVAYFYAALHLVDALLCQMEDLHPPNHEERNRCVKEKSYLRAIRTQYRSLKDHADDARYNLITMTSVRIEGAILPLYRAIESHIKPQLIGEPPGGGFAHPLLTPITPKNK